VISALKFVTNCPKWLCQCWKHWKKLLGRFSKARE